MINSLLDMDFYKFTMGQLIHKNHPEVPVEYKLFDRDNKSLSTKINISRLKEELGRLVLKKRSPEYLATSNF